MKKLFLTLIVLGGLIAVQAEDINAVQFVQGTTVDWYLLIDNTEVTFVEHNPVIGCKTYDLTLGEVETTFGTAPAEQWYTVRTDGVAGNWNSICLERNIIGIDGATFWTVSGQTATQFVLDQITEPQAGEGYLIRFTAAELKVQYGTDYKETPVTATAANPMQGTYTQINFDDEGRNELVDNYVVYNNQLCPVVSHVGMYAHRAYLKIALVPNDVPAPAPGRARAYMPKPHQTPTDAVNVNVNVNKFILNGQFVIVKDNKMYNAQGMKL